MGLLWRHLDIKLSTLSVYLWRHPWLGFLALSHIVMVCMYDVLACASSHVPIVAY